MSGPLVRKYQALGNDYLVLDPADFATEPEGRAARALCDRQLGLGADGILVGPLRGPGPDLRIYNPDGSEAAKSGNGLRIYAACLVERGLAGPGEFPLRTKGGPVRARVDRVSGLVRVDMGAPDFSAAAVPVRATGPELVDEAAEFGGLQCRITSLSMGNPHCVVLGLGAEEALAKRLGPLVERDPRFPDRANVQFLEVLDRARIRIAIWERGAGWTLASGSSSCAAAAAARRLGLVGDEVEVLMPGGYLRVEFREGTCYLEGPAEKCYEANLSPELLARAGLEPAARLSEPPSETRTGSAEAARPPARGGAARAGAAQYRPALRAEDLLAPTPAGGLPATRLEVDLDALSHNVSEVRRLLRAGPPARDGRPPLLCAVLKADAYGLGAVPVAAEFLRAGAELLAVARLGEALELRRALGPERFGPAGIPLLVMGHTPDAELPLAQRAGLVLAIFDESQALLLSGLARETGRPARVQLKIDTGFNRLGIKPDAGTDALLSRIAALPGLRVEGVFTHLALADEASDRAQFALFERVLEGRELGVRHVCDSIGLCRYPEMRLDLVRAGAILYGARPGRAPLAETLELRVPFALKTRVSRLRRLAPGEGVGYDYTWRAPEGGALVATLPVGYADGYRRCLSNKGEVLWRGVRSPVVGLICMDQLVVDASRVPEAREGDEVLLLGRSGTDEIPLLEAAGWAGTNRNELLAGIGRRVPRLYLRGGAPAGLLDYLAPHGGALGGTP